jgi:ligand-binding SRPBCC domain-containing protein
MIGIMKVYSLIAEQKIKLSISEAWEFFSNPNNLKKITPEHLGFHITNELPDKMYAGMLITYKLSPIKPFKVTWVTEITQVNEPHHFIDNQRFGPYSMWHHQHFFEEIDGGVLMKDIIHYVIPFGIFGRIANRLFVRRQLNGIFAFRKKVLKEMFGEID